MDTNEIGHRWNRRVDAEETHTAGTNAAGLKAAAIGTAGIGTAATASKRHPNLQED